MSESEYKDIDNMNRDLLLGDRQANEKIGKIYSIKDHKLHSYIFGKLKPEAMVGNKYAQNIMGEMYYNGIGTTIDKHEALKYYKLSADQGYADAQANLAHLYYCRFGTEQDNQQALKYYKLSAEQGNACAQNWLGYMYERGIGVAQDYQQALKYFELAAEQGYPDAHYNLGYLHYHGLGTKQDLCQAIKYYKLGADQGDKAAKYCLKLILDNNDIMLRVFCALTKENDELKSYITDLEHRPGGPGYEKSKKEFDLLSNGGSIHQLNQ